MRSMTERSHSGLLGGEILLLYKLAWTDAAVVAGEAGNWQSVGPETDSSVLSDAG